MKRWRTVAGWIAAGLVVASVVKELRKPADERTWQGKVLGFVPYDFRVPTLERARETFWNPSGPLLTGELFGVGWTINFGRVKALIAGQA